MSIDLFLLKTALRDAVRPKRLTAGLLLLLLPALMGLLWRSLAPAGKFVPADAYNLLSSLLVFGFILTILAVIYGTGVLSQDIEQRTIVYLLTRPVPRWRILLSKFIAGWLAITLTASLAAILLAVVVFGPVKMFSSAPFLRDLRILPVGALAYGSLFLLLATLLARPLIYGLLFAFAWESWVPSMRGAFGRLSIMTYLRVLAPHPLGENDAALDAVAPTGIPMGQAWLILGLLIALPLLAALITFSVREYAPREDAG